MNSKYILNFTPTGLIPTKEQNKNVPIEINEIIEEVHFANELGITLVHLHARDRNGVNTGRKDIYTQILSGIKKHCPDLVLGVSLSGRLKNSFDERTEVLELYPDMASLTLGSLNFMNHESINSPETIVNLISKMNEYGVNPELECFDIGMINFAKYLIYKNKLTKPFYFNLLFGNIFSAQAELSHIDLLTKELPEDSYVGLGGLGDNQLKINTIALASKYGVRVGLEDNIWFDKNRKIAASNINLIKRIHNIAEILERPLFSSKEFGELGFYNKNRK